jgi:hypothetical protein
MGKPNSVETPWDGQFGEDACRLTPDDQADTNRYKIPVPAKSWLHPGCLIAPEATRQPRGLER